MAELSQFLSPNEVLLRHSRLRLINTTLQNKFGMQRGGANVRMNPTGRRGAYDVINDTREVATARRPGATSATIAAVPRGTVSFVIPRVAERKPLLLENLHNYRPVGGPVNTIDENGELYIRDEEQRSRQRITNCREFQVAAMLRGSYTYTVSGDDLVHGFSGGAHTVNYQIPAGNKSQLNMLGGGDIIGTAWDNAAAPIISDLFQINAAFNQLIGYGLREMLVNSVVWGFILANTQVQAQAGTVNQVFDQLSRNEETEEFTVRLKAAPWVKITVTDNGLNLAGTFTKLIPDTAAVFLAGKPGMARMTWCSEPVVDTWRRQQIASSEEHYWYEPKSDPARYEGYSLYNGLPNLLDPQAIAFGTVDF